MPPIATFERPVGDSEGNRRQVPRMTFEADGPLLTFVLPTYRLH